ncbi:MAG: hypothetical protein IJS09_10380, partial [Treponema sp.]|nr:hypothetical protein [Treponema sp.]
PEEPEEPDPASVELNISIKATSTSDVTVRNVREGKVVTFTAEEGWTTYTWKIDGKVQTTTGNILKVDTTDWGKGSYDITLIVTKSDANDLYSAQVTIE